MALALTNKTGSTSTAQTGTSASVAYSNNTLYICTLGAHSTSGNVALVTPVTSNGMTWTQVAKTNAAVDQLAVYCAYVSSGAGTGTQAFDSGQANTSRLAWGIAEVTGSAATAAAGGLDAFGTPGYLQRQASGTSASVTLGAFSDAVNNVALGFIGVAGNATITVEGGYSTLHSTANSGLSRLVEYILGQDLAVTATWTGGAPNLGIALEVKVPSAGDSVGMIPI